MTWRLSLQRGERTEDGTRTRFNTVAMLKREPTEIIAFAATLGITLHRKGGVSLSGLPRSGGATICWGQLRERCERMDGELREGCSGHERPDALISTAGPFMLRVGSDF